MKRLLALLLLFAGVAHAQFTIPQRGGIVGTSGGATTVTFSAGIICKGSSPFNPSVTCVWTGSAPSAGNAVAIVVWVQNTSATITSVCDGTGTGQCTGTSVWNSQAGYANASNYFSQVWYTCNYAGVTGLSQAMTISLSTSSLTYVAGMAMTGNSTTGTACNDGYAQGQSTVAGATATSAAMSATTNTHDCVVGLFTNNTGVTPTAGTDGHGNSMTISISELGVPVLEYVNETTTNTYSASMTMTPSAVWNMEVMAFK